MTVAAVVLAGVDVALFILAVEAIVLGLYRWCTGAGLSYTSVALISLAGLGLLVALKAALLHANPVWLGLGLAVGGIAHGFDVVRRIRMET